MCNYPENCRIEHWVFIGKCLIYSSYRNSYMLIAPKLTIQRQKEKRLFLKHKVINLWFKGLPELHLYATYCDSPQLDSIQVIKPNIELIADFLPKMSSVIADSRIIENIPDEGVQHYNFSTCMWNFNVDNVSSGGLYRYRQYPWGLPRYFIKTENQDLPSLEINNAQDWIFLVSRYYLGYELPIEVVAQQQSHKIILNSKLYKELPLLLKRALLSKMLTSPIYIDGSLHIFDVSLTLLEKMDTGDLPIKVRLIDGK